VIASSFDSPVEVLGSSPEVMTMDPGDLIKFLQANSVKVALAVGPGLGFDSMRAQWLKKLVELAPKRVVLDADALTMLAEHSFGPLPSTWVLTPHSGELSRLLGIDSKQVDLDPLAATEEAVKRFGCHVLLKGYHSILGVKTRAGCKRIIIPTGNAALAKAGSGDVLTGMIAGLMSQGLSTKKATVMAAYLHGAIADKWTSDKKDISSLMASDIILNMPEVLGILRR
jgi:NAD(P)H-hydrate epimerase